MRSYSSLQKIMLEASDKVRCPMFMKGLDNTYYYANSAFRMIYDNTPIVGEKAATVFSREDAQRFAEEDRECMENGHATGQRTSPDGRFWLVEKVAVTLPDGTPAIVGIVFDITDYRDEQITALEEIRAMKREADRKAILLAEAKEKIEYVSLHDAHTGLANRRYLEQRLAEAAASKQEIAILHVDLDRFKQINDTYGHAAGDFVLRHVATTMVQTTRLGDFVSRVGGDEFAILCDYEGDMRRIIRLAERVVARLSEPVSFNGKECRIGASVGVALPNIDGVNPEQMLVNADIALYRAKTSGRNRVEVFSRKIQEEILEDNRLSEDLSRGIIAGEFIPVYEPQICAKKLTLHGVEALVRWQHPTDGLLSPFKFLPIAEKFDRLGDIDKLMLAQALKDIDGLREKGISIPKLSVNVSAQRLNDSGLIESLKYLSFKPGTLTFELVETILFDETDETWAWQIDRIREMGIEIEIDDFGTGYASIVSLLKLEPTRMKIDRQFVSNLTSSTHAQRVVEAMIDIGRSLGIAVIAEGVETLEQAQVLREMGCDILQGWLFSKPMTCEELSKYAVQTPVFDLMQV